MPPHAGAVGGDFAASFPLTAAGEYAMISNVFRSLVGEVSLKQD